MCEKRSNYGNGDTTFQETLKKRFNDEFEKERAALRESRVRTQKVVRRIFCASCVCLALFTAVLIAGLLKMFF